VCGVDPGSAAHHCVMLRARETAENERYRRMPATEGRSCKSR
jgi:hypothetical protein